LHAHELVYSLSICGVPCCSLQYRCCTCVLSLSHSHARARAHTHKHTHTNTHTRTHTRSLSLTKMRAQCTKPVRNTWIRANIRWQSSTLLAVVWTIAAQCSRSTSSPGLIALVATNALPLSGSTTCWKGSVSSILLAVFAMSCSGSYILDAPR
jgi:hypothetical protein